MFDDRLEILSPGGMIDGRYIQDLDITKISSMRRNRIISDIFNRLHFMDRRGSGLTRIIETYHENETKPIFISDASSFKVILPNKGYKKNEEVKYTQNIVNDKDYFIVQLHKTIYGNVKNTTITKIQKLFDKFGYTKDFDREDVQIIFEIKKSRASEIISKLLNIGLIEESTSNKTKYKFKK